MFLFLLHIYNKIIKHYSNYDVCKLSVRIFKSCMPIIHPSLSFCILQNIRNICISCKNTNLKGEFVGSNNALCLKIAGPADGTSSVLGMVMKSCGGPPYISSLRKSTCSHLCKVLRVAWQRGEATGRSVRIKRKFRLWKQLFYQVT